MATARLRLVALPLLAACLAVAIYHHSIGYGLNYDDYHFVRPYPLAEIAAAFTGTWDPTHIEVPFYRPLTVAFFAARFVLLGFHPAGYHVASIALFALVAMLAGVFVRVTTGRESHAVLATALVCVHPAMVQSLVGWITNQMHLVEALLVLATYLAWFQARVNPRGWWRVLVPACAALLVKEDAVMLLISVAFVHVLFRRLADRSLPPAPRWFLLAAVAIPAAFALVRYEALGGLGGYGRPDASTAVRRIASTIWLVLFQTSGRQPVERAITFALYAAVPIGTVAALVRGGAARFLVLAGGGLLVCFSLPFAFATKAQQLHLAALTTCIWLTGALASLAGAFKNRPARCAAWATLASLLVLMAWVSSAAVRGFAPDAPYTLYTDGIVRGWAVVPEEIREMLARKRPGGPPVGVADLDQIIYGLGASERTASGDTFRWSGERIEVFTRASRGVVRLEANATMIPQIGRTRVTVDIAALGFPPRELVLSSDDAVPLSIPFSRRWFVPAGVPSIRMRIHPTFSPAVVFRSKDDRTLGIQVSDVRLEAR